MARTFPLTIVTPDGKKIQDDAVILNVRTTSGQLGILAGHLPLVAVVEISKMNYKKEDGSSIDLAVAGGILSVTKTEVIVLAEAFETKDEIDEQRALESKLRAENRINSNDPNVDMKRAELSLQRALIRLSLK